MEKREALKIWTVLLAILTFSFSLLGTFLVRSGVLTSVHAFATDPGARRVHSRNPRGLHRRGACAVRAAGRSLKAGGMFAPISREGRAGSQQPVPDHRRRNGSGRHALSAAARIGDRHKISVGPPFFNLTFGPLMVPLLLCLAVARSLAGPAWRGAGGMDGRGRGSGASVQNQAWQG
jgi:cytochrome c-type biogenesis protein CcmF